MRRITAWTAIALVAAFVAAGLLGAAQPAAAQQGFGNFFGYQNQKPRRRVQRRTRKAKPAEETAEKAEDAKKDTGPSGPVYVVISIGDQQISVYDRTGRIARSRVSTGMRGHATPTGIFSVIGKRRHHYSNLYGGAPMPWMQRITWSGVAMHAGVVPGYPASHGCIRLPYSFAPQLWKMTKMGARVVVARNDTEPFPIAHPALPLPTMQPAPASAQQASRASQPQVELVSLESPSRVAMTENTETLTPKALDPIAYAAALKERAKADKKAAEEAEKETLAAAQTAGAEAREAVEDVSKAQAEFEAAQANLAVIDGAPSAPQEPSDPEAAAAAREAMDTARTAARSEFVRARAALEAARRREAEKNPAAFRAVEMYKAAVAANESAARTLKEAERRAEPVSVFISRKEGRVFIRQDWKEVYEAPVTIRDPDRPLGTHVFIAVDAESDGSAVRWSAISVPTEEPRSDDRRKKKSAKDIPELPLAKSNVAVEDTGPGTAAGALDRIELPEEARKRIAELLWTGASLIVSDYGRSHEMGEYTDFIVLTR